MKIELMDQPILIIRSTQPPKSRESEILGKEALEQIENLLEEEISEIRNKLQSESNLTLEEYFTPFNLHLQTEQEITSVILESEWREQDEEIKEQEQGPLDLQVSKLMRVVKITYESNEECNATRPKLLKWLSEQKDKQIPSICGLNHMDFILISAKEILPMMNSLQLQLL
jgi:hypothetical protein